MSNFFRKIPVLRYLMATLEKRKFDSQWRKRNPHNETKVGDRAFPMEVATIGKGTYGTINIQSLYLTPNEKITIGNYVSIAPKVTFLLGMNHQMDSATTFPFYSKLIKRSPVDAISNGPISIEDEVWIGTHALIFSGVRVGKGAIIAAGSIVTKDVPPYAIVGGNPAKVIRYRFTDEIIQLLKPICFVDFSEEWIKENIDMIYKRIETVDDALQLKALADSYQAKKK